MVKKLVGCFCTVDVGGFFVARPLADSAALLMDYYSFSSSDLLSDEKVAD